MICVSQNIPSVNSHRPTAIIWFWQEYSDERYVFRFLAEALSASRWVLFSLEYVQEQKYSQLAWFAPMTNTAPPDAPWNAASHTTRSSQPNWMHPVQQLVPLQRQRVSFPDLTPPPPPIRMTALWRQSRWLTSVCSAQFFSSSRFILIIYPHLRHSCCMSHAASSTLMSLP